MRVVSFLTVDEYGFPEGVVDDGARDGWEPLFAIADVAGGDWPSRARTSAVLLKVDHDEASDDAESLSLHLLRDLRDVFDAARWLVRSGSPWRYLPKDFPPWEMVYQQTRRWLARADGRHLRQPHAPVDPRERRTRRLRRP